MNRIRKLTAALAGLLLGTATVLTVAAPAAHAQPAHQVSACSQAYYDGDWRLGPATVPNTGLIGGELSGWSRFGGLTPAQYLAKYWDATTGSWIFPPDNGFLLVNGRPVEWQQTLQPGQDVQRYGENDDYFLAPEGTPYAQVSIPPSFLDDEPGNPTCDFHTFTVDKPFTVEAGPIAPGVGQPGGGLQYVTTETVQWLLDNGYLTATN